MNYNIYTDPNHPAEQTLTGLKGSSFIETGYVYAPYVPLQVTPLFPTDSPIYRRIRKAGLKRVPVVGFSPEDFKPRTGILTRYAKKAVRADYYGLIEVLG